LGEPDDLPEERDLVTSEAGRLAPPVPVLVGGRHRHDRGVGEREQAQDLGAAVAAQADQLVAQAGAVPGNRVEAADARGGRTRRRARDVAHRLRRAVPVDPLQPRLELEVVAADELGHARGGA
jgi:hypothetical protein